MAQYPAERTFRNLVLLQLVTNDPIGCQSPHCLEVTCAISPEHLALVLNTNSMPQKFELSFFDGKPAYFEMSLLAWYALLIDEAGSSHEFTDWLHTHGQYGFVLAYHHSFQAE
jgi:hypothetical protein